MAASVLFGLAFADSEIIPPLLIRQILIGHAGGTAASVALPAIVGMLVVTYLFHGAARYVYGGLAGWCRAPWAAATCAWPEIS